MTIVGMRWCTALLTGLLVTPLATSLTGCTARGELVAPDGARRLQAGDPASGITVVMTTTAWDGDDWVAEEFTPVHVLISNRGERPVRLAPGDFEFEDRRGFRYPLTDVGHYFNTASPGASTVRVSASYDTGLDPRFRAQAVPREVSAAVLPWGVLQPGTSMRGFLLFDPIPETANGGVLRWYAITPEQQTLALFEFELAVARPG